MNQPEPHPQFPNQLHNAPFSPPLPMDFLPSHPVLPAPPPSALPPDYIVLDKHVNPPLRTDHTQSFPWFSEEFLNHCTPSRQSGMSSLQENAWLMEGAAALSMCSSSYIQKIYLQPEIRVEILPRAVYAAYYLYHTFFALQSIAKYSPIEIALTSFFLSLKLYQNEIHPKPATILACYLRRSKFRHLPHIPNSTAIFHNNTPQPVSLISSLSPRFPSSLGPEQWNMLIELTSEHDMKQYIEKTAILQHDLQQLTGKPTLNQDEVIPPTIQSRITSQLTNSVFGYMCQRMLFLESILCETIQYQFNIPYLSKDVGKIIGSIYIQAELPMPLVPKSYSIFNDNLPHLKQTLLDPLTLVVLIERTHQMLEIICAYTRWILIYPPHQLSVLAVLCAIDSLRADFQTAHPTVQLPPLCQDPTHYTVEPIPQHVAPQYVSTSLFKDFQLVDINTLEKLYQTRWFNNHKLLNHCIGPTIGCFNATREANAKISASIATAGEKMRKHIELGSQTGKLTKDFTFVPIKGEEDHEHDKYLEQFRELIGEARTQPTMVYMRLFMQPPHHRSDVPKPDPYFRIPSTASMANIVEANEFCREAKHRYFQPNHPLVQSIPPCSCQQTMLMRPMGQNNQQRQQGGFPGQPMHDGLNPGNTHIDLDHFQHAPPMSGFGMDGMIIGHSGQQMDQDNSTFANSVHLSNIGTGNTGNTGNTSNDHNSSTRNTANNQKQELQMGTPVPLLYHEDEDPV